MQWRHKEKQRLLAQLEETAEAHHIEHVAQKAREEAKKWRIAEEKEKKKKLEYLQQLQNKVLAEDTTLLEDIEESQIAGSK